MVYALEQKMKQLLHYEVATGEFCRIQKTRGRLSTWGIGTITKTGYRRIAIDGKRYLAHRLAWLYVHGSFPVEQLDHINGDRLDNRICNLREASQSQNLRNKKRTQSVNKYLKGAKFVAITGKWTAKIVFNKNTHHLGTFDTELEAHHAYAKAAGELHKEFARFS